MINMRKENNVLIVYPNVEELNASIAARFKDEMEKVIKEGNNIIIINLTGIEFIDSTGLASIVSSLKLIGRNGQLVLCGLHRNVMSVFKLTRMDRVFQIFSSEEEAISFLLK